MVEVIRAMLDGVPHLISSCVRNEDRDVLIIAEGGAVFREPHEVAVVGDNRHIPHRLENFQQRIDTGTLISTAKDTNLHQLTPWVTSVIRELESLPPLEASCSFFSFSTS